MPSTMHRSTSCAATSNATSYRSSSSAPRRRWFSTPDSATRMRSRRLAGSAVRMGALVDRKLSHDRAEPERLADLDALGGDLELPHGLLEIAEAFFQDADPLAKLDRAVDESFDVAQEDHVVGQVAYPDVRHPEFHQVAQLVDEDQRHADVLQVAPERVQPFAQVVAGDREAVSAHAVDHHDARGVP